jgi:hypothetical protein
MAATATNGAAAAVTVRIQAEDFDIATEIAALADGSADIGAVTTFTGLCRDEGGRLSSLELEHYPGMAERAIRAIATMRQRRAFRSSPGSLRSIAMARLRRAATSCWWSPPHHTGRPPLTARRS